MLDVFSLGSLPLYKTGRSRAINAENPKGEKGKACTAASNLGVGRKGSPCLRNVVQGTECVLMDIDGCGVVNHIWVTVTDHTEEGLFVLRDLVLRMYWDEETFPSVEVPLGDFFCCGFAREALVNSQPIVVNPTRGMNCFFPMPFAGHAKITVENQHGAVIPAIFYQIDYRELDELPTSMAYFHAQWHRQAMTSLGNDYVILDNVNGRGQYVGTYLSIATLQRYWWGEGEVKFYLDGDRDYPTICSTGTEDYFGGAWSFASREDGQTEEHTFCTPFMGYPYFSRSDALTQSLYYLNDKPTERGLYRFHIPDPISFEQDLMVTLQQIGVNKQDGLFERQDDVSSVAYWYQGEPHIPFLPLLPKEKRWPR